MRAVASGRVVFADWLRGFGNLMILDHGGGYMSLYGNNECAVSPSRRRGQSRRPDRGRRAPAAATRKRVYTLSCDFRENHSTR